LLYVQTCDIFLLNYLNKEACMFAFKNRNPRARKNPFKFDITVESLLTDAISSTQLLGDDKILRAFSAYFQEDVIEGILRQAQSLVADSKLQEDFKDTRVQNTARSIMDSIRKLDNIKENGKYTNDYAAQLLINELESKRITINEATLELINKILLKAKRQQITKKVIDYGATPTTLYVFPSELRRIEKIESLLNKLKKPDYSSIGTFIKAVEEIINWMISITPTYRLKLEDGSIIAFEGLQNLRPVGLFPSDRKLLVEFRKYLNDASGSLELYTDDKRRNRIENGAGVLQPIDAHMGALLFLLRPTVDATDRTYSLPFLEGLYATGLGFLKEFYNEFSMRLFSLSEIDLYFGNKSATAGRFCGSYIQVISKFTPLIIKSNKSSIASRIQQSVFSDIPDNKGDIQRWKKDLAKKMKPFLTVGMNGGTLALDTGYPYKIKLTSSKIVPEINKFVKKPQLRIPREEYPTLSKELTNDLRRNPALLAAVNVLRDNDLQTLEFLCKYTNQFCEGLLHFSKLAFVQYLGLPPALWTNLPDGTQVFTTAAKSKDLGSDKPAPLNKESISTPLDILHFTKLFAFQHSSSVGQAFYQFDYNHNRIGTQILQAKEGKFMSPVLLPSTELFTNKGYFFDDSKAPQRSGKSSNQMYQLFNANKIEELAPPSYRYYAVGSWHSRNNSMALFKQSKGYSKSNSFNSLTDLYEFMSPETRKQEKRDADPSNFDAAYLSSWYRANLFGYNTFVDRFTDDDELDEKTLDMFGVSLPITKKFLTFGKNKNPSPLWVLEDFKNHNGLSVTAFTNLSLKKLDDFKREKEKERKQTIEDFFSEKREAREASLLTAMEGINTEKCNEYFKELFEIQEGVVEPFLKNAEFDKVLRRTLQQIKFSIQPDILKELREEQRATRRPKTKALITKTAYNLRIKDGAIPNKFLTIYDKRELEGVEAVQTLIDLGDQAGKAFLFSEFSKAATSSAKSKLNRKLFLYIPVSFLESVERSEDQDKLLLPVRAIPERLRGRRIREQLRPSGIMPDDFYRENPTVSVRPDIMCGVMKVLAEGGYFAPLAGLKKYGASLNPDQEPFIKTPFEIMTGLPQNDGSILETPISTLMKDEASELQKTEGVIIDVLHLIKFCHKLDKFGLFDLSLALRMVFLESAQFKDCVLQETLGSAVDLQSIQDPQLRRNVVDLNKDIKAAKLLVPRSSTDPTEVPARPYEYQQIGIAFMESLNFVGIFGDDMGLGKTIQGMGSIWLCQEQYKAGKRDIPALPAAIMAPASIIKKWKTKELDKWFPEWNSQVLTSQSLKNKKPLLDKADVLVMSIDAIKNFDIYNYLVLERKINFVLVDEAHRYKNPESGLGFAFLDLIGLSEGVYPQKVLPLRDKARNLIKIEGKIGSKVTIDGDHYALFKKSENNYRLPNDRIVPYRVLMTGTLLENRLTELFVPLHTVDPISFPSIEEFQKEYLAAQILLPSGGMVDRDPTSVIEILKHYLQCVQVRRFKNDVLRALNFPAKERRQFFFLLNAREDYYYNEIATQLFEKAKTRRKERRVEIAAGLFKDSKVTKTRSGSRFVDYCLGEANDQIEDISEGLEAALIASVGMVAKQELARVIGRAKIGPTLKWVNEFFTNPEFIKEDIKNKKRLVIFIKHKFVSDAISQGLTDLGYENVVIDGSVPTNKRQDLIDAFQAGDYPVIIGSQAIREGINLWEANHLLFSELWYVPARMEQAEDRIWRIGQTKDCFITYMIAQRMDGTNTADQRLFDILGEKRALVDAVIGLEKNEEKDSMGRIDASKAAEDVARSLLGEQLQVLAEQFRSVQVAYMAELSDLAAYLGLPASLLKNDPQTAKRFLIDRIISAGALGLKSPASLLPVKTNIIKRAIEVLAQITPKLLSNSDLPQYIQMEDEIEVIGANKFEDIELDEALWAFIPSFEDGRLDLSRVPLVVLSKFVELLAIQLEGEIAKQDPFTKDQRKFIEAMLYVLNKLRLSSTQMISQRKKDGSIKKSAWKSYKGRQSPLFIKVEENQGKFNSSLIIIDQAMTEHKGEPTYLSENIELDDKELTLEEILQSEGLEDYFNVNLRIKQGNRIRRYPLMAALRNLERIDAQKLKPKDINALKTFLDKINRIIIPVSVEDE
jgi:SNF2 family DNA or RNA helicase